MSLWLIYPFVSFTQVLVGLDRIFEEEPYYRSIRGCNIALISHNAAIDSKGNDTLTVLRAHTQECCVKVLCTLEHGYYGSSPIETPSYSISNSVGIRRVSLYGVKEFPKEALYDCDVLVYDVQDIGIRSYSFVTALMQVVQAAEKYHKKLIILDRPNPMGGKLIDGPMPDVQLSYVPAIPYCYGMTPGELGLFFKKIYAPTADILVVPMKGWNRSMTFEQTGLTWIPTSPQMPDAKTPFFYATTGILGSLSVASIGVGYTLPFRLLGAPWMNGQEVAQELNHMQLPGIMFFPFCYEPFFGKYKMELCSGVLLVLKDPKTFLPVETFCTILGVLKTKYPKHVENALYAVDRISARRASICRILGDEEFLQICQKERYIIWPLRKRCQEARERFQTLRASCLLSDYRESF
ncbi:yzbB [Candidatus Chlamydia sanziniae]|uniref:YzbB n=2 Tax=Candidatus Chlamydia sanziniae TaxID=1806891 RepID=A0A1A9HV53_9CHLA|nr:yzbB [Candidatus Chlamydia sanziniae]